MKRIAIFSLMVILLIIPIMGVSCDFDGNGNGNDDTDTAPPVISGITISNITETTATISWTTDEPATSQVEYGETTDYGSTTALDETLISNHSVSLSELTMNTTYHFKVKSEDALGNGAMSNDNTLTTIQPVTGVALNKTSTSIAKGLSEQLVVTIQPSNATNQNVTWYSTDNEIATVTSSGLVASANVGTVEVTVITDDQGLTASCMVSVTEAELVSLAISPMDISVEIGSTQAFTATGIYTDRTTADLTAEVTWSSSDYAIASISNVDGSEGLSTGVTDGIVTISAQLGSISSSTTLGVTYPKAVILIDERLYTLLKSEIDEYHELAQSRRRFTIDLDVVNGIDDWSYVMVKDRIKTIKDNNPDLEGVLLIGNIKIPSFFQSRSDNVDLRLIPHYFEDLDGIFRKDIPNGSQIPFGDGLINVPVHDFDFIGKGPNPDSEIWVAFMPVGVAGTENKYTDFEAQLRPYLQKVIRFYRGQIKTNGRYYYVSNDKGERMDLNWETFGKSNIDYYGMVGPNGETGGNCMQDGENVCYVRWPLESYTNYSDFVADWEASYAGEGWQQASIFLSHMAASIYSIVQVNVHSYYGWSLVSTDQARNMTGGGLIVALDGCGVAGMSQPGSPSMTDGQVLPSDNVLLAFLYGNSQSIAGSGDPFTRGHYANHPTIWSRMVTFHDYLGMAHLERMKINYASSDFMDLREWCQEMLVGDPFVVLQEQSDSSK